MRSDRIDGGPIAAAARSRLPPPEDLGEPSADLANAPSEERGLRPSGWIKRLLPRTMFGRSLLIVIMPLVLLQAIAAWIFYDRHWTAVSWRLASGVASDIGLTIEALQLAKSPAATARLLDRVAASTDLQLTLRHGARLPPPWAPGGSLVEQQLIEAMRGRVALPYRIAALVCLAGLGFATAQIGQPGLAVVLTAGALAAAVALVVTGGQGSQVTPAARGSA